MPDFGTASDELENTVAALEQRFISAQKLSELSGSAKDSEVWREAREMAETALFRFPRDRRIATFMAKGIARTEYRLHHQGFDQSEYILLLSALTGMAAYLSIDSIEAYRGDGMRALLALSLWLFGAFVILAIDVVQIRRDVRTIRGSTMLSRQLSERATSMLGIAERQFNREMSSRTLVEIDTGLDEPWRIVRMGVVTPNIDHELWSNVKAYALGSHALNPYNEQAVKLLEIWAPGPSQKSFAIDTVSVGNGSMFVSSRFHQLKEHWRSQSVIQATSFAPLAIMGVLIAWSLVGSLGTYIDRSCTSIVPGCALKIDGYTDLDARRALNEYLSVRSLQTSRKTVLSSKSLGVNCLELYSDGLERAHVSIIKPSYEKDDAKRSFRVGLYSSRSRYWDVSVPDKPDGMWKILSSQALNPFGSEDCELIS